MEEITVVMVRMTVVMVKMTVVHLEIVCFALRQVAVREAQLGRVVGNKCGQQLYPEAEVEG